MPIEITGNETNDELIAKVDLLLAEIDKLMEREVALGLRERKADETGNVDRSTSG